MPISKHDLLREDMETQDFREAYFGEMIALIYMITYFGKTD